MNKLVPGHADHLFLQNAKRTLHMFYTYSGKKINAHSGGKKDLLKCLFRKERLIWNQGLEGDLKRGRERVTLSLEESIQFLCPQ